MMIFSENPENPFCSFILHVSQNVELAALTIKFQNINWLVQFPASSKMRTLEPLRYQIGQCVALMIVDEASHLFWIHVLKYR